MGAVGERAGGQRRAAGTKAPASTLHSKLEPGSEEEKPKLGVGSLVVPEGPESIVVSGAVVSTVKCARRASRRCCPAASVARTGSYGSRRRARRWSAASCRERRRPQSTLHSKLEPGSEEEKAKLGVGSLVVPEGPESIVVWGGVVSTVNELEAGSRRC